MKQVGKRIIADRLLKILIICLDLADIPVLHTQKFQILLTLVILESSYLFRGYRPKMSIKTIM